MTHLKDRSPGMYSYMYCRVHTLYGYNRGICIYALACLGTRLVSYNWVCVCVGRQIFPSDKIYKPPVHPLHNSMFRHSTFQKSILFKISSYSRTQPANMSSYTTDRASPFARAVVSSMRKL